MPDIDILWLDIDILRLDVDNWRKIWPKNGLKLYEMAENLA